MTIEGNVLRTTAGDLPLEEYSLELEGHAWKILHTGALVSREEEDRFLRGEGPRLPYGVALWPAAIALAHDVAARSLRGLRVLELGAGTGLPGIVAASLGARVVQTDNQAVARFVCAKNGERNGVTTIEHRAADFAEWNDRERYDVILASDVLYAGSHHTTLRRIFDENLAEGGTVLASDPFRKGSLAFLEKMEADGWKVVVSRWTVSAGGPERRVGVFELSAPSR